jgi:methylmalonyl-CoA mutase
LAKRRLSCHFAGMTDETLPLAAEFPAASQEQWRKLTEAALKGADFDKTLVSRTYDGLTVAPLYPRAKGAAPVAGRAAVPWQVMARVDHPDPAEANKQALIDLDNGATGLTLVFVGAATTYGYGLPATPEAIERVLDGVLLDAGVAIELELSTAASEAPAHIAALLKKRGIDPARTIIRPGWDNVGYMARQGFTPASWDDLYASIARRAADYSAQGWRDPLIAADGRCVHAAGGSEVQELAFALGNAVGYLRALEARGVALDAARRMMFFRLAADDDQFLTIAKFRALRKLWARVEQASGLTPAPIFISAETAWRMMTQRDPHVNMLRTTIAVAAAGIGGADAITALPFTNALGLPDAFARRVARNIQLVLIEESNLAAVADPAAGAGALEALTGEMARAAWSLLQEIEKVGGAAAAIEQGVVQKKVAAVRAAREAAVAKRKDALTGSSDYPNLDEKLPPVLDVKPAAVAPLPAVKTFDPLPPMRLAAPFEALRDASDRMLAATGARPRVFLATLGKPSAFTARASFARNFYEAGGIAAIGGESYRTTDEMIAAYKHSGATLAGLCSSDKVYEAEATAAAQALKAAGAVVHLAGRPGAHEAEWREAGIGTFIFAGCDALATLRAAHDILTQ